MKTQKPPRNGAELSKRVQDQYSLSSAAGLALLDCASKALDMAVKAEETLEREGLTVPGSRGPRPHPAATIARDARARLISALRSLNLDLGA